MSITKYHKSHVGVLDMYVAFQEASSINKSLSALGNVIMALVDITHGKTRHVHYRDSKLTFLLRVSAFFCLYKNPLLCLTVFTQHNLTGCQNKLSHCVFLVFWGFFYHIRLRLRVLKISRYLKWQHFLRLGPWAPHPAKTMLFGQGEKRFRQN